MLEDFAELEEVPVYSPGQEKEAGEKYEQLREELLELELEDINQFLAKAVMLQAFIEQNSDVLTDSKIVDLMCRDMNWDENGRGVLYHADLQLKLYQAESIDEKQERPPKDQENKPRQTRRLRAYFHRKGTK